MIKKEINYAKKEIQSGGNNPAIKAGRIVAIQGFQSKKAVHKVGVSYQTIVRWRREYGGLKLSQKLKRARKRK